MQVMIVGVNLLSEAREVLVYVIAVNVQIMLEALEVLKMTSDIRHGENV